MYVGMEVCRQTPWEREQPGGAGPGLLGTLGASAHIHTEEGNTADGPGLEARVTRQESFPAGRAMLCSLLWERSERPWENWSLWKGGRLVLVLAVELAPARSGRVTGSPC